MSIKNCVDWLLMSSLQSERALYADNEGKLDEERDTFVSPKLF